MLDTAAALPASQLNVTADAITAGRQGLLFEKKKQKTFATAPAAASAQVLPAYALAKPAEAVVQAGRQKFFASFFQKRRPCLP